MHEPKSTADWHVWCELASKEEDPKKLMEFVKKLNQALDERFKDITAKNSETRDRS